MKGTQNKVFRTGGRVGAYELVRRLTQEDGVQTWEGFGPLLRGGKGPVLVSVSAPDSSLVTLGRRLQGLDHDNLVRVLSVGTVGGAGVVVRERPKAWTARRVWEELVSRGRGMAPRAVVEFGVGAARGLDAALERGLAHGLLGPDDVLVGWDGAVKVSGFATPDPDHNRLDHAALARMLADLLQGAQTDGRPGARLAGLSELIDGVLAQPSSGVRRFGPLVDALEGLLLRAPPAGSLRDEIDRLRRRRKTPRTSSADRFAGVPEPPSSKTQDWTGIPEPPSSRTQDWTGIPEPPSSRTVDWTHSPGDDEG